jgi:hypothetical protein
VAIVQISRITQRKGLQENLPQLAGAEFGWSIDQRKLYIGNGTLAEGAPEIGNTEILTEYSDLQSLLVPYTDTLLDNTSTTPFFSLATTLSQAYYVTYKIVRSSAVRQGTIMATVGPSYMDDYTENSSTGVTITVTESGGFLTLNYATTSTGVPATISYYVNYQS